MELYKKTVRKALILFTLLFCLMWVASTEDNVVKAYTCDECFSDRAACIISCGSGNTACLNNCQIAFNHCIRFCEDDPGGGTCGNSCSSDLDCLGSGTGECGFCLPSGTGKTCQ